MSPAVKKDLKCNEHRRRVVVLSTDARNKVIRLRQKSAFIQEYKIQIQKKGQFVRKR